MDEFSFAASLEEDEEDVQHGSDSKSNRYKTNKRVGVVGIKSNDVPTSRFSWGPKIHAQKQWHHLRGNVNKDDDDHDADDNHDKEWDLADSQQSISSSLASGLGSNHTMEHVHSQSTVASQASIAGGGVMGRTKSQRMKQRQLQQQKHQQNQQQQEQRMSRSPTTVVQRSEMLASKPVKATARTTAAAAARTKKTAAFGSDRPSPSSSSRAPSSSSSSATRSKPPTTKRARASAPPATPAATMPTTTTAPATPLVQEARKAPRYTPVSASFPTPMSTPSSITTTSQHRIRRKRQAAKHGRQQSAAQHKQRLRKQKQKRDDNEWHSLQSPIDTPSVASTLSSAHSLSTPTALFRSTAQRKLLRSTQSHVSSASVASSSSATFATASTTSRPQSIVRAGPTNVEDAGTYQMNHDDCIYMCNTILTAKRQSQRLEAALDLVHLLQNRKTRALLWRHHKSTDARCSTVLHAIGQVVAAASSSSSCQKQQQQQPTASTRTKSARRKLATQPHVQDDHGMSVSLRQAISMIVYHLSYDCTLHKTRSVGATQEETARWMRSQILQHGGMMRGIASLLIQEQRVCETQPATHDMPQHNDSQEDSQESMLSFSSLTESQERCDPTALGRKKRRKRRRVAAPHNDNNDDKTVGSLAQSVPPKQRSTSPSSVASMPGLSSDRMDRFKAKFVIHGVAGDAQAQEDSSACALLWTLESLQRIITGKDEVSEHASWQTAKVELPDVDNGTASETDDDDDERNNPLLQTNRWLARSDCLPILSRAMAKTLREHKRTVVDRYKITVLASLLDGACLWHSQNRETICRDPELMSALMRVICDDTDSEIAFVALRTLTSLTHQNPIAANQILERCGDLADACYAFANDSYDCCILCLNIMANIVEMVDLQRSMLSWQVPKGRRHGVDRIEDTSWLAWMCNWTVAQTHSFRDALLTPPTAVVATTTATTQNEGVASSARALQADEDDRLIAAGNGCVLMACLLLKSDASRPMIHTALPGATIHDKLSFLRNTLRAFCNYYHLSMGDELGAILITPIQKLMKGIEAMDRSDEQ